ncbi:MAG TPA: hypothetical protein HPP97_13500 [Desulfuromonadales bacterium]|nr:hypothetical protein [Desulfuromonadales bacterium]
MKKKMIMLIAAAMMTLSAGSAFAANFANMDLIRVITDKTTGSTLEIATDLGSITTLASLAPNTIVGGGVADAFTNYIGTASLSNLSVQYFAVNRTSALAGQMWIGLDSVVTSTSTAGLAAIQNKYAITSTTASVNKYYNSINPTASTVVANSTNAASLSGTNGSTTLGSYAGYTGLNSSDAVQSLANLATASVATTIWSYGPGNMGLAYTGVKVLDLTTNADGSTTINAVATAATPIPAAAWLLGSGLMGLFGLRRKMNA